MKNFICSLLIPVFLFQAVGCYNSTVIQPGELNKFTDKKLYLRTTDASEYILLNGSEEPNISNWEISDDSLFLVTDRLKRYSQNEVIVEEERTTIPYSSINSIRRDEFNYVTSCLLTLGIMVVFTGILIAIDPPKFILF